MSLFIVSGENMNDLGFIDLIHQKNKNGYFTDEDLKIFFPKKALSSIHNSLSYYLKTKKILKFKRGFYYLESSGYKDRSSKFSMANELYGPSYISFESALSFHNLIPEAVYETTSACFLNKQKKFQTPLGMFSYSYSPLNSFFLEVERNEEFHFLIATPLRALFDLINSRKRNYKDLQELEGDLRVDLDELRKILESYSANDIIEFGEMYKKRTTNQLAKILVRNFK